MPRVFAIVGPTAVGKSGLALEVAERLGAEIVNADALQVYRGLEIGTAKPSLEERRRVRHHLVDILDPGERFSAGRFAELARSALREIAVRGRPAVVVGGSGLYHRALFQGIAPLPEIDPNVRSAIAARLESDGLSELRMQLARLDPESARRIGAGDAQRITRALEVVLSSGRPLSDWILSAPFGRDILPVLRVGLTLPRAVLYDRIGSRVSHMVERGWVSEVSGLLAAGVGPDAPAFQAIGYAQWLRHLAGEFDVEEAAARIVTATRRYAKRQEAWFRREPEVEWHDARATGPLADRLVSGCEK